MSTRELVSERVHQLYWNENLNCQKTTLTVLSEIFEHKKDIKSPQRTLPPGYCGLVKGGVLYLCHLSEKKGLNEEEITQLYLKGFEERFKRLLCRELRGKKIQPCKQQHPCEGFTIDAILFDIEFIEKIL